MQNICFYARAAQCILYGKIGKELESKFNVCYITQNAKEADKLKFLGCKGNIYVLTEYIENNWLDAKTLNIYKTLGEIEMKYEISSIWSLFYTDRFLIHYDLEDSIKFIKLHTTFFENIIKKEKCEYLFNESIAIFSSYLFYVVGKKLNCKYRGFAVPTNYSNEKFYFTDGLYNMNPKMDFYYENNLLDEKEIENAKKFVDYFKKTKYKPDYQKISGKVPVFKGRYILQFGKFILKKLVRSVSRYNYEEYINYKYGGLYGLRNYLKYKFVHRKYYCKPDFKEKYLLFPLHFQPEGTTLVCAPNYEKQQFAVDLLAKKIPGEYILYVKEHYTSLGHRNNNFYRQLKKYPNIKFVDPLTDSHDLIINSKGVIVLTSTVGWEAIIYKKPVFMLGNFMYETFRYINRIENINDLTQIIRKSEKHSFNKDYDLEMYKYIASFFKSLKNGSYILRDSTSLLTNENISKLKNSLIEEISS